MPSERTQRHVDRLLDEADKAIAQRDWVLLRQHAQDVLLLDVDNEDAQNFLTAAKRALSSSSSETAHVAASLPPMRDLEHADVPTAFAAGRYSVKRPLSGDGKKRVYLAHDTTVDRDVASALIKTEGLDLTARGRIVREAQAMATSRASSEDAKWRQVSCHPGCWMSSNAD
jgi:hypothetical protein